MMTGNTSRVKVAGSDGGEGLLLQVAWLKKASAMQYHPRHEAN